MSELNLGGLQPKQKTAFDSLATETLYGGAAGGGKSHLFRVAALYWAAAIPGLQVYIFRRTFPDLWKNHMDGPTSFPSLLAPWVNDDFAKINYSKNVISLFNKSQIHLCHCQYEKDKFGYQGAEIHVLMMDELTQFTKTIYEYLRSRVRLTGLKIPTAYQGLFPRIVCGANPGGVGHTWVKAAFIDIARPMEITRRPKEDGGMLRQFIPAKLEDNPALAESDPDYEDRLSGLGNEALVKAMRDGDWNIVAGGMFDDVWDEKIHVLEPFDIPSTWLVDRSFDWGSSHPFSVGWWAMSDGSEVRMSNGDLRTFPAGTLFRVAEYYGWNGQPNEGCRLLAVEIARKIKEIEKTFSFNPVPGPADTAIFSVENGNSIADDMARAGVAWNRADKSPGSRVTGWEAMRRMFKASTVSPMEDAGLFVFSTCRQFIRTIPVLPRDERKPDDLNTNAEDHIADETRYRVMTPTFQPSKQRFWK